MQSSKKLGIKLLPTLLVLMAMLLVACGGGSTSTTTTVPSQKAPASQQVLNMGFFNGVSDNKTFDPALSTDTNSIAAIYLVFTGLVQFDHNLKIQPQLASSYDLASDGLTWTFHLRPNQKFSDGTPLNTADVVYSINRALLPATKSVVGPVYLALIKDSDKLNAGKIPTIIGDSLLTPDPNTVVIIANQKAAYSWMHWHTRLPTWLRRAWSTSMA
jgi:oligopeptide transport system substrate-binding protein